MCDKCENCGCTKTEIITKKGEKGLQGDPGPQGRAGAQGATGAQGLQGDQGDQGVQGDPGPQGDDGPAGAGGASTSIDYTGIIAAAHINNAPNIIYGAGWSNVATIAADTIREVFGDMNQFRGFFEWNGEWDGITDQNVFIEFDGPLMAAAPTRPMIMIVVVDTFNNAPVQVEVVDIAGTNYLKIPLSNSDAVPNLIKNYKFTISGITIYD